MSDSATPEIEKFGTVLGIAPGNVPVYCSHYPSADPAEYPHRESYRSYLDDEYMGYKWQCVELARRWLYVNHGYVFDDVAMAYDIFRLDSVRVVKDGTRLPLRAFRNGSPRAPVPGCMLVWNEGGEFQVTGHVAIVTEVLPDRVRVVEQNVAQHRWPPGQGWSRELPMRVDEAGRCRIDATMPGASILGWMIQSDDASHAVTHAEVDTRLFDLGARRLADAGQHRAPWLDVRREDEAAFVASMGGHRLTTGEADQYLYFRLSETALFEVRRATNELHAMFMHATQAVLRDDKLLARFNIPEVLWPRLRVSWEKRHGQMISGRFDFSVSARGVKAYEYNADSASCHLEAGKIQGKWAAHFGCQDGRDPGEPLFGALVEAWQGAGVEGVLHVMYDCDMEEAYHARYMKAAAEAAGLRCKMIRGLAGLGWNARNEVVDAEGEPIRWVWKTWAWETALDQLRDECGDDDQRVPIALGPADAQHAAPRLADVLLRRDVVVFEPLWTLIPSNKAILPILWSMFPDHPYLLESRFSRGKAFAGEGYVVKPIAGRCGANISIYDAHAALVTETEGRYDEQDQIYQAYFPLPTLEGLNVQVCSFAVDGLYAGVCVRVAPSLVITTDSDLLPLRIVADDEMR